MGGKYKVREAQTIAQHVRNILQKPLWVISYTIFLSLFKMLSEFPSILNCTMKQKLIKVFAYLSMGACFHQGKLKIMWKYCYLRCIHIFIIRNYKLFTLRYWLQCAMKVCAQKVSSIMDFISLCILYVYVYILCIFDDQIKFFNISKFLKKTLLITDTRTQRSKPK